MKRAIAIFGLLIGVLCITSMSYASDGKMKQSTECGVSQGFTYDFVNVADYSFNSYAENSFEQAISFGFTNPNVAVEATPIPIPEGTITYIENKKNLYRSPFVDTSYIWKESVNRLC